MDSEIIISFLGIFIAAILGATFSYAVSRRISKVSYRNTLTHEILKHFNSPDFLYTLQVLQEIKSNKWKSEDGKKLVNFFIPIEGIEKISDETMKNNLTIHQNLTLYLRFIAQVYVYLKDKSVNEELIENIIIREHFSWHKLFFKEFLTEYDKICQEHNFNPEKIIWYKALKEFSARLKK